MSWGKILFVLLMNCFVCLAWAHEPNQITYHFQETEKSGLTIYLTPKTIIDLLQNLYPELVDQTIIDFNSYQSDLELYFNHTIDLTINGQAQNLKWQGANLYQHEASLTFQLSDPPLSFNEFDLTLNSFVEIYQHPSNHIKVNSLYQQVSTILSSEHTHCSFQLAPRVLAAMPADWIGAPPLIRNQVFYIGLVVSFLGLVGFLITQNHYL